MKNPATHARIAAAALSALLSLTLPTVGRGQAAPVSAPKPIRDELVKMDEFTVTTGFRSPKTIDQIPGAVKLITNTEITDTLLLTEDATAVLSRTIPGYAEATQQMQNTGETLRGRIALRLFDGISQSTPLREANRNGTFTDMGVIERIEVINGPSAAEGIGAAGGIINYLSKSPTKEGSEATLTSRFSTQGPNNTDGWKVGLNYANKRGPADVFVATAFGNRNLAKDANGRLIGFGQSGSTMDTEEKNLFIKAGYNFGNQNAQRVALTISRFNLAGKGNYSILLGDRAKGITDSSIRVPPPSGKAEFNEFNQYALAYKHADLVGGTLTVQAYKASQAMRFLSTDGTDPSRQDPLIAPLGTLADQSEVNSQKRGIRSSWARSRLFEVEGLDLNVGYDYLEETAKQFLALTNRVWVPPMNYTSNAPFAQVSYNRGPLTLSGGFRREDGKLQVDSYTTTFFNNRVRVNGGSLDYKANLPNVGAIWRLPRNWSVFGSYSKGFTLPNVGIPLRNINVPGKSVSGILDLQAVIVDNKEAGFAWRGNGASFSASIYRSYSALGSNLTVSPITRDFILQRRPVKVQGGEANADYSFSKTLKINALYSHMEGTTVPFERGPLNVRQGVTNSSPDKFGTSLSWRYTEKGAITFGQTTLVGRELNVGKGSYEKTRGYTLLNLSSTYSTKWGDFSIGIENLLDRYYILTWVQVDQFQNYFAGRGRTFTVTHSLKF